MKAARDNAWLLLGCSSKHDALLPTLGYMLPSSTVLARCWDLLEIWWDVSTVVAVFSVIAWLTLLQIIVLHCGVELSMLGLLHEQ